MTTYYMTPLGSVFRNEHMPEGDVPNGWQPVAVVPYEDREQVERFSAAYLDVAARMDKSHDRSWYDDEAAVDQTQAALREFANPTPPRPEEPTDPAARVYCDIAGERVEWARVPGRVNDLPGEHPVWVNGWGGRCTWADLVEAYDVEVVLP